MRKMKCLNLEKIFLLLLLIFIGVNPVFAVTELEEKYYSHLPTLKEKFRKVEAVRTDLIAKNQNIKKLEKSLTEKVQQLEAIGISEDELKNEVEKGNDDLRKLVQEVLKTGEDYSSNLATYREEVLRPLIDRYSWAIPNEEALETIAKYSPLIEIGAGSGYWAHLLTERNSEMDLVAYDDNSWVEEGKHQIQSPWFEVQNGGVFKLSENQNWNRSLFLCWPPTHQMAFDALSRFMGMYVIYVGETPERMKEINLPLRPAHANKEFFVFLDNGFEKIKEVEIPNWPGYQDKLYIYKRKVFGFYPNVFNSSTEGGLIEINEGEIGQIQPPSICNRLQSYLFWLGEFFVHPVRKIKLY